MQLGVRTCYIYFIAVLEDDIRAYWHITQDGILRSLWMYLCDSICFCNDVNVRLSMEYVRRYALKSPYAPRRNLN